MSTKRAWDSLCHRLAPLAGVIGLHAAHGMGVSHGVHASREATLTWRRPASAEHDVVSWHFGPPTRWHRRERRARETGERDGRERRARCSPNALPLHGAADHLISHGAPTTSLPQRAWCSHMSCDLGMMVAIPSVRNLTLTDGHGHGTTGTADTTRQ